MKPVSNKDDIRLLQKEIKSLEKSKVALIKEKSVIGDSIYTINQWKVNFKAFRLHLANQSLEVIEYHSNRYLTEMGSEKLSGTLRELSHHLVEEKKADYYLHQF